MSLESIIKKKVGNLETIPNTFIGVVDAQNALLFQALLKLLDSLDSIDGVIPLTDKNIAVITKVNDLMKATLFASAYLIGLKDFIKGFDTQAGLVNDIFSAQFDFSEKSLYKSVLKQSQKSTLQFLDEDAIGKAVFEPLQNNLLTNIYNGGKYSDMVTSIKDFILGDSNLDPKLTSYASRYARDSMAIFDNTYTQIIANDIGVEYWEYSGGTLEDSREFCLQRVDRVYTTEEIRKWADKEWKGKNPATNAETIFAYRGGYNCIHSLIPRDPEYVDNVSVNTYN